MWCYKNKNYFQNYFCVVRKIIFDYIKQKKEEKNNGKVTKKNFQA